MSACGKWQRPRHWIVVEAERGAQVRFLLESASSAVAVNRARFGVGFEIAFWLA